MRKLGLPLKIALLLALLLTTTILSFNEGHRIGYIDGTLDEIQNSLNSYLEMANLYTECLNKE